MTRGDHVIYLADPLKFGGELEIIGFADDGRLVVEQVNLDPEDEHFPVRALLDAHQVELASVWAAT